MDNFEDFIAQSPEYSYEDIIKVQDIMHQDIMASTLPKVDMAALADAIPLSPINSVLAPQIMGSMVPAIDMFGIPHFIDPMSVDIMSGLPSNSFHINQTPSTEYEPAESYDQWRLNKGEEIEAMRDAAVAHYNDAKSRGDIDEMLKWETEANKQQGRLYDHWGTPTYGLPPKAPGIN